MVEKTLGNIRFLFDREKTAAAYALMQQGGADDCSCSYCRNFITQRESVYPAAILRTFEEIGIESLGEGKIYECGPSGDGRRNYGGWLFFVGELLEKGEHLVTESGFEYWIGNGGKPSPTVGFDGPLITFEFVTKLPWLLDEDCD